MSAIMINRPQRLILLNRYVSRRCGNGELIQRLLILPSRVDGSMILSACAIPVNYDELSTIDEFVNCESPERRTQLTFFDGSSLDWVVETPDEVWARIDIQIRLEKQGAD
jgi:hypothetical protein